MDDQEAAIEEMQKRYGNTGWALYFLRERGQEIRFYPAEEVLDALRKDLRRQGHGNGRAIW